MHHPILSTRANQREKVTCVLFNQNVINSSRPGPHPGYTRTHELRQASCVECDSARSRATEASVRRRVLCTGTKCEWVYSTWLFFFLYGALYELIRV